MGNMYRFMPGGDLNELDIPGVVPELRHFTRTEAMRTGGAFISGEATPKIFSAFAVGAALDAQIARAWEEGDDATVAEIIAYEVQIKT